MTHGNLQKKRIEYDQRLIFACFIFAINRHHTIRMKPNEVNSLNEQHLRNTVYNYDRLEPSSSTSSALSKVSLNVAGETRRYRKKRLQRRKAVFKVGDYVRLSKYKTVFEKGYTPNWTTEIFKIRKVQYNTEPITYLLFDYRNREIKGSVYGEELQKVKYPDAYLVEKIIRRSNGRVYVKWLGFSSEHNSWISERDIED